MALVALRDRDDQAQVRVDHLVLRLEVAALDPLRELDLLLLRQQRVAPDLLHEELERVGRRDGEVAVDVGRLRLAAAVVAELDAAALDLLVEVLELVLAELERLDELVHLGVLEALVLLAAVEQCTAALGSIADFSLSTLREINIEHMFYTPAQTWLARSTSRTPASRL